MQHIRVYICGLIVGLVVCVSGRIDAADQALLTLRQEYNAVSATIDSLVRVMEIVDAEVLDGPKLPEGRTERFVPDGMSAVMIFWADDEARVWLNDFLVGETRLTPVEVAVPDLYLQDQNRIRARCWDTDWVESGFMCGLYLKDAAGTLYPIVVSSGAWQSTEGAATEITYAHPSPDIPEAEPIWGPRVFGVVELAVDFEGQAVRKAVNRAVDASGIQDAQKRTMSYHDFVRQLAVLQARREKLMGDLEAYRTPELNTTGFSGHAGGRSAWLTLGKAGPLVEAVSKPVAQSVRNWSRDLPEAQQQLIYPDQRALKGEAAANLTDGGVAGTGGEAGARDQAYRPPEERGAAPGKSGQGAKGKGVAGTSNLEGEGGEGSFAGGFGGGNRASRLGLLLPTIILGLYVLYVATHWDTITGREEQS